MNIVGLDSLVFGVKDVAACTRYFTDYGLNPVGVDERGGTFEGADGTSVVIRREDDPSLPAPMGTASQLRETVYGVADAGTLEAIRRELSSDRQVTQTKDGALRVVDDAGFALRFQLTVRHAFDAQSERVNSPGLPPLRPANGIGAIAGRRILPSTLSHVVYFVPDYAKAEAFYMNRLGFRCTDRFTNVGPFLRPQGTLDHHSLFLIQTPPFMKGVEHFTFHVAGPTELMDAGTRFADKGYQTFWGPGRHLFGSNWFWYFNSPLGCHVEYDADMDLHDDSWAARDRPATADTSQLFHFQNRAKWIPMGPPGK